MSVRKRVQTRTIAPTDCTDYLCYAGGRNTRLRGGQAAANPPSFPKRARINRGFSLALFRKEGPPAGGGVLLPQSRVLSPDYKQYP